MVRVNTGPIIGNDHPHAKTMRAPVLRSAGLHYQSAPGPADRLQRIHYYVREHLSDLARKSLYMNMLVIAPLHVDPLEADLVRVELKHLFQNLMNIDGDCLI